MKCRICAHENLIDFIKIDRWTVKKCLQCGHGITDPLTNLEESDNLYSTNYFSHHYDEVYPGQPAFQKKIKQESSRVKFLRSSKKAGDLLDVGCGKGYFLYACKNHFRCTGFDITNANQAFIRDSLNLNLEISPWDKARFKPQSFDAITLWHSLEHILDPFSALRKCVTWLKNDGVIIIEVPNHGGTDGRILYDKWPDWDIPFHTHHFTRESLLCMLAKIDLIPSQISTYHSECIKENLSQNLFTRPFARLIAKRFDGNGIVVHCRKK